MHNKIHTIGKSKRSKSVEEKMFKGYLEVDWKAFELES